MSHEIRKLRERITTVKYEIAQEEDKITFLQEMLESRLKTKEQSLTNNWKWENIYQMGLEQTELEIKICEAKREKLINEIKFLRIEVEDKKQKLAQ